MARCSVMLVLFVALSTCGLAASSRVAPAGFPAFTWDTLPVFWHAWGPQPFNKTTLEFISRFPLATIEKGMSSETNPRHTAAEEKIIAAAKQIKEHNASTKVLFYLNTQMDYKQYDLHKYCLQHKELMWLYDSRKQPVEIRNESIFDMSKPEVRQTWMNVLLHAHQSGSIDGAFLDKADDPSVGQRRHVFKYVNDTKYNAFEQGHRTLMSAINSTFGPEFLTVGNGKDYDALTGRMFQQFMVNGSHNATTYADIAILQHEATYPHIAEVINGPCTPATFNTTLAGYLIGAGQYAYYGCTNGFSLDTGWLHWFSEYSKKLGEPLSLAKPISSAGGFCAEWNNNHHQSWYTKNEFWELVTDTAAVMQGSRHALSAWVENFLMRNPDTAAPVLGRVYKSGTCVTLDFGSTPPASCIAWADGTHTGSTTDCLHKA